MNSDKTTVWMNVTTSVSWQRPPVGIVRVERSLCAELSNLYGDRFKRCIWRNGRFEEWIQVEDEKSVNRADLNADKVNEAADESLPPIYPVISKRQAVVAIIQGLLSLTPRVFRPSINSILYYIRPKVGVFLRSTIVRIVLKSLRKKIPFNSKIQSREVGATAKSKSIFNSGDVLLSVGLDWDYPYYKSFYELKKNNGVKIVSCCYDLIPVLYPQYCVNDVAGIFTSYFLEVADGSDLVLCISKQSEKDLNDMLACTGGARVATLVFPLGDNVPSVGDEDISDQVKQVCQSNFILFVSTIERRKNHEVLYRAYHLLCKQGKQADLPKLVFVGMPGWGVGDLLKDIELDPLTRNLIIRLNHVNDSELRILYESSLFCVFPSLYEGWGLPVGEALSMGKAVLCSDRGSLPEVGGDLVLYIEPWNPQRWADEIYKMVTDVVWRNKWEQSVKHGYAIRTWTDAAESVKKGIDKLGENDYK